MGWDGMGWDGIVPSHAEPCFKHLPFSRAFYADHFAKNSFLISSTNDDARVKTLKSVRLLQYLTFFSILTLAPSSVDEIRKLFLAK